MPTKGAYEQQVEVQPTRAALASPTGKYFSTDRGLTMLFLCFLLVHVFGDMHGIIFIIPVVS